MPLQGQFIRNSNPVPLEKITKASGVVLSFDTKKSWLGQDARKGTSAPAHEKENGLACNSPLASDQERLGGLVCGDADGGLVRRRCGAGARNELTTEGLPLPRIVGIVSGLSGWSDDGLTSCSGRVTGALVNGKLGEDRSSIGTYPAPVCQVAEECTSLCSGGAYEWVTTGSGVAEGEQAIGRIEEEGLVLKVFASVGWADDGWWFTTCTGVLVICSFAINCSFMATCWKYCWMISSMNLDIASENERTCQPLHGSESKKNSGFLHFLSKMLISM